MMYGVPWNLLQYSAHRLKIRVSVVRIRPWAPRPKAYLQGLSLHSQN